MSAPDYFIPNRDPQWFYPLRDFLDAPPITVAQEYIAALTAPGDVVIDPFGALPNVALAAYALERRALVVASNPLWAWLAYAMATLPAATEIDAALTRLGDVPKDDVALRVHLQQLYATRCAACHQLTPADYFVRTRQGGIVARHYTCAQCGVTRDDPATEEDLRRAEAIAARGIHYHFALARVLPASGAYADRLRKLLDLYTPRNLSALATLTQKIQARFHATREYTVLLLLLLHALERGAAFFAAPDAAPQLTPQAQFIEFNLWREIERGARALATQAESAGVTRLAELATSPREVSNAAARVFIGRGSAKTLARDLPRSSVALVLTAPPPRRVAVWALAYFWGAWILGRAAVEALAPFLDARKGAAWEWQWYAGALNHAFTELAPLLRAQARVVLAFRAAWHPVVEALLLAAAGAPLQLETFVFQPRCGDFPRHELDDVAGEYRVAFVQAIGGRRPPTDAPTLQKQIRASALAAANQVFAQRGEALAFSFLHHAAFTRLAREGLLADARVTKLKTALGRFVHDAVIAGLRDGYADDFDHHVSADQFVWLRRSSVSELPLIERVEEAVRHILSRGALTPEQVCDALYRQFPGALTPEAGLIELCVAAYVAPPTDAERARALDALLRLGARLGYEPISDFRFPISDSPPSAIENRKSKIENFDVVWQANGEMAQVFVWRDRAQFADLAHLHVAPTRGYVVVPENLVALLREKMRRLPHRADAFYEAGWNFIRAAFVAELLAREKIERNDFALIVGLMPPAADQRAQLGLL